MHAVSLKLLLLHLFLIFFLQDMGYAMIEAVNRQPITWKPDLRAFHVGCVVDKMALGQLFSEYFGFSTVIIIPPVLHTDPLIYHRCQKILVIDSNIT
jgi:hypothetical protein